MYVPIARHSVYLDQSYDIVLNDLLENKRKISKGVFVPAALDGNTIAGRLGISGSPGHRSLTLEEIDQLEPVAFENWLADEEKLGGLEVKTNPISGDGGADLLLCLPGDGRHAIIQCKYRGRSTDLVDQTPVDDVLRTRKRFDIADALLVAVTNADDFNSGVVRRASAEGIQLFARKRLFKTMASINELLERSP